MFRQYVKMINFAFLHDGVLAGHVVDEWAALRTWFWLLGRALRRAMENLGCKHEDCTLSKENPYGPKPAVECAKAKREARRKLREARRKLREG